MLVLGRFVLFGAKKQIKIATFEVSRAGSKGRSYVGMESCPPRGEGEFERARGIFKC